MCESKVEFQKGDDDREKRLERTLEDTRGRSEKAAISFEAYRLADLNKEKSRRTLQAGFFEDRLVGVPDFVTPIESLAIVRIEWPTILNTCRKVYKEICRK